MRVRKLNNNFVIQKPTPMKKAFGCLLTVLAFVAVAFTSAAQGTAFTYQGRLFDAGNPANGKYDLRFNLWDALSGGGLSHRWSERRHTLFPGHHARAA
jgi:hypothetical protein